MKENSRIRSGAAKGDGGGGGGSRGQEEALWRVGGASRIACGGGEARRVLLFIVEHYNSGMINFC